MIRIGAGSRGPETRPGLVLPKSTRRQRFKRGDSIITSSRRDILIDHCIRLALKVAYRCLQFFWFVFRPQMRGVNVALWYAGELLVIENTYRAGYSLPGGYIHFRESEGAAARREMREELHLDIAARELRRWGQLENRCEFKRDRVTFFEVRRDARPHIRVDNREVLAAGFMHPEALASQPCNAPLAAYLAAKRA